MVEQTILNGLNSSELCDVIGCVKENPVSGKYRFRAAHNWIDGGHCQTSIKDFWAGGHEDTSRQKTHVIEADEPVVLLGHDNGANATEGLLHALASCLSTSFIYHATAQGVKVEELALDLEGEIDLNGFLGLDESVRNGYESICVNFKVKADAPREKIAELCEYAQKRSPVFDIVSHPVDVSVKLEIL